MFLVLSFDGTISLRVRTYFMEVWAFVLLGVYACYVSGIVLPGMDCFGYRFACLGVLI